MAPGVPGRDPPARSEPDSRHLRPHPLRGVRRRGLVRDRRSRPTRPGRLSLVRGPARRHVQGAGRDGVPGGGRSESPRDRGRRAGVRDRRRAGRRRAGGRGARRLQGGPRRRARRRGAGAPQRVQAADALARRAGRGGRADVGHGQAGQGCAPAAPAHARRARAARRGVRPLFCGTRESHRDYRGMRSCHPSAALVHYEHNVCCVVRRPVRARAQRGHAQAGPRRARSPASSKRGSRPPISRGSRATRA